METSAKDSNLQLLSLAASFTGSGINGNDSDLVTTVDLPNRIEPLPSQEVELMETMSGMKFQNAHTTTRRFLHRKWN